MSARLSIGVTAYMPGMNIPAAAIQVGKDFDLAVSVQDLRPDAEYPQNGDMRSAIRGVFAAYVNIPYNTALAAVRVQEVQTITITGPTAGNFMLIYGDKVSSKIVYDNSTAARRAMTAGYIADALNLLLGAGTVSAQSVAANRYAVRFLKYDVDHPILRDTSANVSVLETVKGDPNDPNVFKDAFKFSSTYSNGKNVSRNALGISALGAFANFNPDGITQTGDKPIEMVRVRMLARAAGSLDLMPDMTGLLRPVYDTLLFGSTWTDNPLESPVVQTGDVKMTGASLSLTA